MAAVSVGGASGAGLRWGVVAAWPAGSFPWAVLLVNLAGSFLLGVVMASEWARPRLRVLLHDGAGLGFCGGLTTMSTFAVEVAELVGEGQEVTAGVYVTASVLGGLLAVVAGAAVLHRVAALRLPLEEEP